MFDFKKVKPVLTTILAFGVITAQSIPAAHAEGLDGNIRLYTGQKNLDSDDWQSMDSQGELGLLMDFKKEEWPVSIAVDLIVSGSDSSSGDLINDSGFTSELHLGLRKTWDLQSIAIHPYVGGGIALIGGGLELRDSLGEFDDDDTDSSVGAWIGTGAYWSVTPSFNLGIDVRYSSAEASIFDRDMEVGGLHTGLTFGYSF